MTTLTRTRRIALVGAAGLFAITGLAGCSEDAADKVAGVASSAAAAAESAAAAAASAAESAAAEVRESASAAVSESVAASASAAGGSSSGDLCADADAVKASLDALVNTKILDEGTATLKARFATFKADSEALLASAQAEFAVQTAAVTASISILDAAITGLADSPSVAQAALIKPALEAVKASAEDLIAAVDAAC